MSTDEYRLAGMVLAGLVVLGAGFMTVTAFIRSVARTNEIESKIKDIELNTASSVAALEKTSHEQAQQFTAMSANLKNLTDRVAELVQIINRRGPDVIGCQR